MADVTKIDTFLEVLHPPHGWRLLRVIACANPALERLTGLINKRTGALCLWKRTEPSLQLLESQPSMERSFYVGQINP
jgi:hypothetical protein